VIRFSAALVVVAIGVLIGGVATSKLTLVYIAIAVSAAALIMLAIGVVLRREELFGEGQELAPAAAGGSGHVPAPGLPVSAVDGADRIRHDSVRQDGAAATAISPFSGLAAPLAQSARGKDSGLADAGRGAAGGGWDRAGQDRAGRPSFGQPAAAPRQNPARDPWPTPDPGPGWPGDREREPLPPWAASGSGTASGYGEPPGYGVSRDNAGRPPLPGRHSRNVGAADPWPPPAPPAPPGTGSVPESSSPSSSAPRRVPGATLGTGATLGSWFDQQAESDRQARSAVGAADKPAAADSAVADSAVADSAVTAGTVAGSGVPDSKPWDSKPWDSPVGSGRSVATPGDPAADDAPEATSSAGTSAGGGWSSGGWSWSSPSSALSDDTVTSAATEAPVEAGVSASTASGDDDDDWPSRYSWLEDDESDKSGDPDDTPSASTGLAESAGDDVTTAGADKDADEDKDAPVTQTTAVSTGETAETVTGAGLVTVLPGVPRYHHEDCILIRFMPKDDVQNLTIPDAEKLGCTPCTACQSED
jgi:hypothetical protein